jgi:hypothetical protein
VNAAQQQQQCKPHLVRLSLFVVLTLWLFSSFLQMLAMKFLHYQQDHSHLAAGEEEGGSAKQQQQQQQQPGTPPASLYNLAAAMIKVSHNTSIIYQYGVVLIVSGWQGQLALCCCVSALLCSE